MLFSAGPGVAGLAAAQQLTRVGHEVTVFERDDRPGGLLRYGIPEFKMSKAVLDRRLGQLRVEGTRFVTSCEVGRDLTVAQLRAGYTTMVPGVSCADAQPHSDTHHIGQHQPTEEPDTRKGAMTFPV